MNIQTANPDYRAAENFILEKLKTDLSPTLYYHGAHHTLQVMDAAMEIAEFEGVAENDKKLLRIAVAFHDAGFLFTYDAHEERGCEIVRTELPGFGFSSEEIESICQLIMSTKIPQHANTQLERIICDADLDYLGHENGAEIAKTLFAELYERGSVANEQEWNAIQLKFLEEHRYHTGFSVRFREAGKKRYEEELRKKKGDGGLPMFDDR